MNVDRLDVEPVGIPGSNLGRGFPVLHIAAAVDLQLTGAAVDPPVDLRARDLAGPEEPGEAGACQRRVAPTD